MATSSPRLAIQVAELLGQHVPGSALLHGRQRLVDGSAMSDIDFVVSEPEVLPRLLGVLSEEGLDCVVALLYDVCCWSFFLCDDSLAGVQLDVTADPHGDMRYFMRSAEFVSGSHDSGGVRSVSEIDGWLYELVKRASKGDVLRLSELLAAAPLPPADAISRAGQLFSPGGGRVVERALSGEVSKPPSRWGSRRQLQRILTRLRNPAGLLVHVPEGGVPEMSNELEEMLRGLLPHVRTIELRRWSPGRLGLPVGVMRFRWLPAMVLVTGCRPLVEHLSLQGSDRRTAVDRLCAEAGARSAEMIRAWLVRTRN